MDWVPRLVRHRTARVEAARQRIEMEMGRKATDDEIATMADLVREAIAAGAVGMSTTRTLLHRDRDGDVKHEEDVEQQRRDRQHHQGKECKYAHRQNYRRWGEPYTAKHARCGCSGTGHNPNALN
jgi:DNA-directed RNA polymerase specialized sigma subunit